MAINKQEEEAFEKLWKIELLRDIIKIEEGFGNGRVERTCKSDNLRAINFTRYGFEEGIKFANRGLSE